MSLVIACLVVGTSALNASAQSTGTETPPSDELLILRAEKAFLLTAADDLTVRLESCNELLQLCNENAPKDEGESVKSYIIVALVGVISGFVVAEVLD